jgi:hypothetical protein
MKDNIGLVRHCIRMLDEQCNYILGTYCNKFSETLMQRKFAQYPNYETSWGNYIRNNLDKFKGKRVTDCGGIIKGYLWWKDDDPVYNPDNDRAVDTMFEQANIYGKINTIPDIPGVIVRYSGHAGVYIGDGEVIEARGTKYGVVKTKLQYRPWTDWFYHIDIDYESYNILYTDVNKYHWAYADIKRMKDLNILVGYSDGSFKPNQSPTRAELAVVINRILKEVGK